MCVESGEPEQDLRKVGPFVVAVDFDGVIHSYEQGWHNGSIYGTPKEGCVEALLELRRAELSILIYSVRAVSRIQHGGVTHGQAREMMDWMNRYNVPYDSIWTGVGKPFAHLYLDDNAVRFTNWASALLTIKGLHSDWLTSIG